MSRDRQRMVIKGSYMVAVVARGRSRMLHTMLRS